METGSNTCMRCNRTFKRLEHLKRHERIHDNYGRFPCSTCDKVFTRSDVLRRHEAVHIAALTPEGPDTGTKRACTECAKARERCTKSHPCQRCLTKSLLCIYPQSRSNARAQGRLQSHDQMVQLSAVAVTQASDLRTQPVVAESVPAASDHSSGILAPNEQPGASGPYEMQHSGPFDVPGMGISNHSSNHILQPDMDFSLNWLPNDDSISIDYDNILGLGIGSLGLFPPTTASISPLDVATPPGVGLMGSNIYSQAQSQVRYASRVTAPWQMTSTDTPSGRNSGMVSQLKLTRSEPGGLYATSSNGARMPCTIRGRRSSRLVPTATPLKPLADLMDNRPEAADNVGFPDTSQIALERDFAPSGTHAPSEPIIGPIMYENLLWQFGKLCLNDHNVFPRFNSANFPSLAALNLFAMLYFDNFDPIVPIVHHCVVSLHDHWILALAICAVGCQYAEADEFSNCVEPLHLMLHRALKIELDGWEAYSKGENSHEIAVAQALSLNQIGLLYFGSARLLKLASGQHGVLVELVRSSGFLNASLSMGGTNRTTSDHDLSITWRRALLTECKRRIGYTVWLLDCMSVYHHSNRPLMRPDMGECSLPNDMLWATTNSDDFAMLPELAHNVPSLSTAVTQLFRDKQARPDLSQFSHVILLHGVYREIFQLKDCFARPLGKWVPSMQQALDERNARKNTTVLDANGQSLLSSWRNAALDCVDVLHWAANATIALQAGAEHPTVMHLHFSRTVLLAPFDQIQTLATSIASVSPNFVLAGTDAFSGQQITEAEHDVLHWAQRDQYKARLAVLHCGCLFWHVRRYSCKAFYEPHAVYLATLMMWAYSSYAARARKESNLNPSANENGGHAGDTYSTPQNAEDRPSPMSDIDVMPTFIHLDRPNDDEMVQLFVLSGGPSNMNAHISGVGDLYSSRGPARVLREGRKILGSVSTAWGRTKKYIALLQALEKVSSGRDPQDTETPSDHAHQT
ncbi:hypothetical protein FB567DRAFT_333648 [Paraphoma chrysanthemicola]|uniref:Uncharacterized protein n=1 Tax=Paraphoma chrysanthemicola TaxID=798071 RepID=A0A8K0VZC7_9PLEO|nr:hypothetical protein FB567DRAFT_333648 [Paraphoma chrysanthemicola]